MPDSAQKYVPVLVPTAVCSPVHAWHVCPRLCVWCVGLQVCGSVLCALCVPDTCPQPFVLGVVHPVMCPVFAHVCSRPVCWCLCLMCTQRPRCVGLSQAHLNCWSCPWLQASVCRKHAITHCSGPGRATSWPCSHKGSRQHPHCKTL